MKAASIAQLKKELVRLEHGELLDACLRLARFKKDNKELLTYLMFLQQDETAFANSLCAEIDEQFSFCLLYTSPSPRDKRQSRMPSSA